MNAHDRGPPLDGAAVARSVPMKKAAFLAMASTASAGIGMLAIAWLATRRLTPAELGFFFSFLSFGALVQLADFGLSYAALQKAGELAGTGKLADVPALAALVNRWNILATGLGAGLAALLGWAAFQSAGVAEAGKSVHFKGPWAGYLVGVFVAQLRAPAISLREGSGRVVEMWRLRFSQEGIAALVCLVALHRGAGLWSLTFFAAARGLVATAWLMFGEPLGAPAESHAFPLQRWMSEVWPFQWRIGLSVLSGFFIFRALSPVILVERGPVSAGQFGLAMALMNLLLGVTAAWPLSHAARYSTFFAAGRHRELRREFPSLLWSSTALAFVAAAAACGMLWWARAHQLTFALRLPDLPIMAMILVAAVAHHVVACLAMYMRAEGREPMLLPSVLGGIFTIAIAWLTAHFGTLLQIGAVYLACSVGGIPIALAILRGRRRVLAHTAMSIPVDPGRTGTST